MSGDIIVNIYANKSCQDTAKEQLDSKPPAQRKRYGYRTGCLSWEPGYPRCNDFCMIVARVRVSPDCPEITDIVITTERWGGFTICIEDVLVPSGSGQAYWEQSFLCFCFPGDQFYVTATAYDKNGVLVDQITIATSPCGGLFYEYFTAEEIKSFQRRIREQRQATEKRLLHELRELIEQRMAERGK
jgi:hypothetical protein